MNKKNTTAVEPPYRMLLLISADGRMAGFSGIAVGVGSGVSVGTGVAVNVGRIGVRVGGRVCVAVGVRVGVLVSGGV
jgi:hypothetical protein